MTSNQPNQPRQEKRYYQRYPVMLEVELQSLSSAAGSTARITDLSLGGCYVTTILSVEPGEKIQLVIKSSIGRDFRVDATVIYCDPHLGFGAEFHLKENQEYFLLTLIEHARQDT